MHCSCYRIPSFLPFPWGLNCVTSAEYFGYDDEQRCISKFLAKVDSRHANVTFVGRLEETNI